MYILKENPLGLYEKALPDSFSWQERIIEAKNLGFDFIEPSIDESEERSLRLNWSQAERLEIKNLLYEQNMYFNSMCLSLHRKYSLGSCELKTQTKAMDIMKRALELACDLGIRVIQLAGYDVYYEPSNKHTNRNFLFNLKQATRMAESCNVALAIEIMDTPYINNLFKFRNISQQIGSNHLFAYPDVGNISGWNGDISENLRYGKKDIAAIHLKDSLKVTKTFSGKFRDLTIGTGEVDFKEVFSTLKEIDYNGPLVLELWAQDRSDYKANIITSLKHLRSEAQAAGFSTLD